MMASERNPRPSWERAARACTAAAASELAAARAELDVEGGGSSASALLAARDRIDEALAAYPRLDVARARAKRRITAAREAGAR